MGIQSVQPGSNAPRSSSAPNTNRSGYSMLDSFDESLYHQFGADCGKSGSQMAACGTPDPDHPSAFSFINAAMNAGSQLPDDLVDVYPADMSINDTDTLSPAMEEYSLPSGIVGVTGNGANNQQQQQQQQQQQPVTQPAYVTMMPPVTHNNHASFESAPKLAGTCDGALRGRSPYTGDYGNQCAFQPEDKSLVSSIKQEPAYDDWDSPRPNYCDQPLQNNSPHKRGRKRKQDAIGLSPEERNKKERRRDQNRRAAQKCREKKKREVDVLLDDYQNQKDSNTHLRAEVEKMRKKMREMQNFLQEHTRECPLLSSAPPTSLWQLSPAMDSPATPASQGGSDYRPPSSLFSGSSDQSSSSAYDSDVTHDVGGDLGVGITNRDAFTPCSSKGYR